MLTIFIINLFNKDKKCSKNEKNINKESRRFNYWRKEVKNVVKCGANLLYCYVWKSFEVFQCLINFSHQMKHCKLFFFIIQFHLLTKIMRSHIFNP